MIQSRGKEREGAGVNGWIAHYAIYVQFGTVSVLDTVRQMIEKDGKASHS